MNRAARIPLLLALALPVCGCGQDKGTPRLVLDSQIYDFGHVPDPGKELEVPLHNAGNGALVIEAITKTCDCIVVNTPRKIAPGATEKLVIRSRKGPGSNSIRVRIESNSLGSPHELLLTYFGESPPRVDPPKLIIHRASAGATVQRTVKVNYSGGDRRYPATLKSLTSTIPAVRLRSVKSDPEAKVTSIVSAETRGVIGEETVELSCTVPNQPGIITGECEFVLAQAGKDSKVIMPVEIHVEGPLRFLPNAVLFSGVSPDRLVGTRHHVVLTVDQPDAVPEVVKAPSSIGYSIKPLAIKSKNKSERHYNLELSVIHPPKAEMQRSEIEVQIPGDVRSRVSIPLRFTTYR